VEIDHLDSELDERVKAVLHGEMTNLEALDSGDLHQPHKDALLIIRDRMLGTFNVTLDCLFQEQWLERLIKCECLQEVCDRVASVLNDMLSVTSCELGNVLRKLRHTYRQSFEQMNMSIIHLYEGYIDAKGDFNRCSDELAAAKIELAGKAEGVAEIVGREIQTMTAVYEKQKTKDQETITRVRCSVMCYDVV
jgi:hypothetical protein